MPPVGAHQLNAYPAAMVRLACSKCARAGQYRKGNLIMKYGAAIALPTLLAEIAKCDKAEKVQGCGAYFVDLVPN